jgi:fructose-1-phosphate kinase PfkB-like protein
LERTTGKTFRWKGKYSQFGRAETLDTQLNVFADFKPVIPVDYLRCNYVFLGNIHPQLQLDVINQSPNAYVIAADTMNYWIDSTNELLREVISKVTILFINEDEIKQLVYKDNIYDIADGVLAMGVKYVIIKRGEYGALAYSETMMFNVPAYPVRKVFDTTGAGDCFAGGFMGYLSQFDMIDDDKVKQAMLYGTVTASFNIESFSFDRLVNAGIAEIEGRVDYLKRMISL